MKLAISLHKITDNPEFVVTGTIEPINASIVPSLSTKEELAGLSIIVEIDVAIEINGVKIENYKIVNKHSLVTEFEALKKVLLYDVIS